MNHTQIISLPKIPVLASQVKGQEATLEDVKNDVGILTSYLQHLQASIEGLSSNLYKDLSQGRSRHEVRADTWTIADNIDNGEIKFSHGKSHELQVMLGGVMYYVGLTAIPVGP